jgi:hypothetical protein
MKMQHHPPNQLSQQQRQQKQQRVIAVSFIAWLYIAVGNHWLSGDTTTIATVAAFGIVPTTMTTTRRLLSVERVISSEKRVIAVHAESKSSSSSSFVTTDFDADDDLETKWEANLSILKRASDDKSVDPAIVLQALLDLEQQSRILAKQQQQERSPTAYAENMLQQLYGDWRLIFTTGTVKTQKELLGGAKINYFPLKAVQSFRKSNAIENGIYVGDFPLVKFTGAFDFDLRKRKLEFDFHQLVVLGFLQLSLGQGDAALIGASSGLGSDSNVQNAKKSKRAFFNWISADADIATARGGGGGLALWKRITTSDS